MGEQEKGKEDDQPDSPQNQNTEQTLEDMARKALECPCVADLRDGPCGRQFSEAFICYFKSTAEEKGSDCIEPFLAMQACIQASPESFTEKHERHDPTEADVGDSPVLKRPSSGRKKSKTPSRPTPQPSPN